MDISNLSNEPLIQLITEGATYNSIKKDMNLSLTETRAVLATDLLKEHPKLLESPKIDPDIRTFIQEVGFGYDVASRVVAAKEKMWPVPTSLFFDCITEDGLVDAFKRLTRVQPFIPFLPRVSSLVSCEDRRISTFEYFDGLQIGTLQEAITFIHIVDREAYNEVMAWLDDRNFTPCKGIVANALYAYFSNDIGSISKPNIRCKYMIEKPYTFQKKQKK